MSLRVKCILCGNKLIIEKDETEPLLEHIKNSHPDLNVSKSDLNMINSTCEQVQPLQEIQHGSLNQNVYENRKDQGCKILEGGDWETPEKNFTSKNVRQEINVPETNPKDLSNGQLQNNSPGNDIKIQSEETAQCELEQLLPRESTQKFVGFQYKQNEELTDRTKKFIGLHYNQPSDNKIDIPLKVSIMNNEKDPRVVYKRRYKIKGFPLQCTAGNGSTETLYKNSLEKWKLGKGTISCPKCGANKYPTIKAHTDKVSNSPLGAACILTCWPLCFLPCLFPPPATEYLYCSVCNHLLGVYDRKTDLVQPNNEKPERRDSQKSVKGNYPLREVPDFAKESGVDVKQKKAEKKGNSK